MNANNYQVQSYQSFDPFGLRRNASNWKDLLTSQLSDFDRSVTTRGYTGHEQLDEVGLIHMNGRGYDPKLGRFIQFADNTQSYNRYSYVLNNPLRYTDPSGHVIPMIVGIVMTAAGVSAGYTALAVGVATFAQTLFQGGSFEDALKNGLIAGVSAYAFAQVGYLWLFSRAGYRAAGHECDGERCGWWNYQCIAGG